MKKYYISEDTYTLLVQTKGYGEYYYSIEEPKYYTGDSREITEELYNSLLNYELDFNKLSYNEAITIQNTKTTIFLIECFDEETEESHNFFSLKDWIPIENNWLKELRTSKGLNQKELAKETGLTISTIQNIEQNKRKGSKQTLKILNDYFNNNKLKK